jgi:RND family efflux transporter MFP subunit
MKIGKTVAAFSVTLLAIGCTKPSAAPPPAPVRALRTGAVISRPEPGRLEVDGVVVGRHEAILASRLAAPVAEVRAIPGQTVRSGAVLVRLETAESDSALAGARAALEAARAALVLAGKNRERFENLEARGAAASIELDRSRQEEAAALASVASARAAVGRADTDRAQAALTAPFDAIVVEKLVSPGDLATPGRPLVRLASLTGRRVEAAPGEAEAAALAPGDVLEVVLGGRTVSGRIAEIVGAVDPATRRRTVRIDLPAGVEPPVGSFARVVLAGPPSGRLLVPEGAVLSRGGLELAWAVGGDGRVSMRYVRRGPAAGNGLIEVRSGLQAGERVVVDPPDDLRAGTRIPS